MTGKVLLGKALLEKIININYEVNETKQLLNEKIHYFEKNKNDMTLEVYEVEQTKLNDDIYEAMESLNKHFDFLNEQLDYLRQNCNKMIWEVYNETFEIYNEVYTELIEYQRALSNRYMEYSSRLARFYQNQLKEFDFEYKEEILPLDIGKSWDIGKVIMKKVSRAIFYRHGLIFLRPRILPGLASTMPIIGTLNHIHRKPENLIDIILKDNIEPAIGALIYCQLFTVEHSGIYLGNGNIAHLNGKGNIEIVSPSLFTNNITTSDKDIFIPVDSDDKPVSNYFAAKNAERAIGQRRDYNLLLDNCHQFSAGCISGEFENENNFLWMTKDIFNENAYSNVKWQRWKWYK